MPLVSIIIPVFNRKKLLERAIQSVLKQSFKDFELFIVDDGSDDGTQNLSILNDRKITFIRLEKNSGVSKARNIGVKKSSGEWIAFLDSDDEWFAQKLEKQIGWCRENPEFEIMQTKEIWIRNGKQVNPPMTHQKFQGDLFAASLQRCMITPSSVLLKRSLFETTGGFNETFPVCEDYDLWLRITCQKQIGLLDQYLLKRYGGHSDQLSSLMMGLDRFRIRSMLDLLRSNHLNDIQIKLLRSVLSKKALIVANGYLKRGNESLYEKYRHIAEISR